MNRDMRSTDKFDQMNQEPVATNIAKCPKCGMSWLEEIEIKQYDKDAQVILGQRPAVANAVRFWVLRCVKCGELIEPNVLLTGQDYVGRAYDTFLDEIEAKVAE
jgi:predicted nucleic-acid-binding Zn-ribbon protein